MPTMEVKRICIYAKDIERITGKSNRYGYRLLDRIRTHYHKEEKQLVSIDEFCRYTGLNPEHVKPFFNN